MKHRITPLPTQQLKPGRPEPIWPTMVMLGVVVIIVAVALIFLETL